MYPDKNNISADLDWMMQSQQVSDAQLIQIIVQEFYPRLHRLAVSVVGDIEKARSIVEGAVLATVQDRRRFWGNSTLKAWIYAHTLRCCGVNFPVKPLFQILHFGRSGKPAGWGVLPPGFPANFPAEDRFIGETVGSMTPHQTLLLLLRYVHGLTVSELSYILKVREASILYRLREIRQEIITRMQKGSDAPEKGGAASHNHKLYQQQLCTSLDGGLGDEARHELHQHVLACPECQAYSAGLADLDQRLNRCMQVCWPASEIVSGDAQAITAGTGKNVGKTRQKRRFSHWAKELALLAAVIGGLLGLASLGNWDARESGARPTPTGPADSAQAESSQLSSAATPPARAGAFRRGYFPGSGLIPYSDLNSLNARGQSGRYLSFPRLRGNSAPNQPAPDMNMSGPANLHLLLRYWGENRDPEPYLQPNSRDETVMFYEMVDYIENRTGLAATLRMGGDIDTLKALLRSGIPVMVQIGYDNPEPDGWAGHYTIVNGYEERAGSLILVATFPEDGTDTPIAYDEFQRNWRAFNYSYMLVYPTEKAAEVTTILGKQADEVQNYHWAAEKADAEAALLTSGRDLFFAWYNRGTSLTYLEDYVGAKKAFEKAFSIYETLPFEERPWRMLWYQTRPYWAFFYTGSFQKVIEMATSTLESVGEPLLEESFYWRALAKEALGDLEGAISDLSEAIRLNPNFIAGKYQLRRLQGES